MAQEASNMALSSTSYDQSYSPQNRQISYAQVQINGQSSLRIPTAVCIFVAIPPLKDRNLPGGHVREW